MSPTAERSSITKLPTDQMLEALEKMDDPVELRRLAHEVNVTHSPDTSDEAIKDKIRAVAEHFKERDGTPQIETRSKRVAPGTPLDAPELSVAGEPDVELGDAQKVENPDDLKGPDQKEGEKEDTKTSGKTTKTSK